MGYNSKYFTHFVESTDGLYGFEASLEALQSCSFSRLQRPFYTEFTLLSGYIYKLYTILFSIHNYNIVRSINNNDNQIYKVISIFLGIHLHTCKRMPEKVLACCVWDNFCNFLSLSTKISVNFVFTPTHTHTHQHTHPHTHPHPHTHTPTHPLEVSTLTLMRVDC